MPNNEKVLNDTQEQEVVALEENEAEGLEAFAEEEGIELIDDSDENEDRADIPLSKNVDSYVDEKKPKQSVEENAKYAAARKEAERRAKEAENKLNSIIKSFGAKDYDEFLKKSSSTEMDPKRREKLTEEALEKGLDPEEYIERIEAKEFIKTQKAKEAAEQANKTKEKAAQERIDNELQEFKGKYPDVDMDEMFKISKFANFAKKLLGVQPITDIYEDYMELTGERTSLAERNAVNKAERSTGSGRSGTKIIMSKAQANDLREWNRRNPHLKMTAQEFINFGG